MAVIVSPIVARDQTEQVIAKTANKTITVSGRSIKNVIYQFQPNAGRLTNVQSRSGRNLVDQLLLPGTIFSVNLSAVALRNIRIGKIRQILSNFQRIVPLLTLFPIVAAKVKLLCPNL